MSSLVGYDDSDSEEEAEAAWTSGRAADAAKKGSLGFPSSPCRSTVSLQSQARPGRSVNHAVSSADPGAEGEARPWAGRSGWGPGPLWPRESVEAVPCPLQPSEAFSWPSPAWGQAHSGGRGYCGGWAPPAPRPATAFPKPALAATNGSPFLKRTWEDPALAPEGLKPYIPKRLRQGCSPKAESHVGRESEGPEQALAGPGAREGAREFTRVSEFIRPYLGAKSGRTEIPKRRLFLMSEHRSPVNGIQWCPVLQHSHLLLSVSMDSTFKVWDAIDTGHCLQTYTCHSGAVRAGQWTFCGRKILSGGFDSMLYLTDVETGTQLFSSKNEFQVGTLKFHPNEPNIFLCGGFSPEVKAWDMRNCKVVRVYKAAAQQTLDILFLRDGNEFLSSTDSVSRDSADRTIIAWDFRSTAKISNQIYHERFTCPSLTLHPKEAFFIAQTNGNYMALFSTQRPYRINKKKRYEGHKVDGYAVGCECSPDGTLLVTGSSDGTVFVYHYHSSKLLGTLPGHRQACVGATFHPALPSVLATCAWDGEIQLWQ
ncbi:WD repeat-containing protein 25 [Tachyglossus aculeatus]|uniref:WD repeat-containing protein 25 n=1 Tax=Tachyglossus aculeatus TaxID=9261 RepID=UPI0018F7809D|nr:WD repeat-containing protein 25 [Tachyglossus aculeatus]